MSLYGEQYFSLRKATGWQREVAYRQEFKRVMDRTRYKRGNVIDIGCGTGEFLELFKLAGWQVYGVEVSDYCIQKCNERGITMVEIDYLDDGLAELVIMRGVLQHIDDPFGALRHARRMLANGGMLSILAQPDADSLCYKLFGDLPALDAPRNWWIPGAREVVNILGKLGFGMIKVNHPYLGGPYASPLLDYARFVGRLFGLRKPFAFPGNMMEIFAWV